jgi:hypothetical protein
MPAIFAPVPIAFAQRSTTLVDDEENRRRIAQVVAFLADHTEVELVAVESHAFAHHSERRNDRLTALRATAVRDALVAAGVAPNRVIGVGFGEWCVHDGEERTTISVARVNGALVPGAHFGCHEARSLIPRVLR